MVIARIRRLDSGTVSANNAPQRWTHREASRPANIFLVKPTQTEQIRRETLRLRRSVSANRVRAGWASSPILAHCVAN